ncbi:hypothetical protein ACQBAT_00735 [Ornithinimicrobium sp. Y1847]|uniref:hypothetical protein n=1 Tax=Ornithinimicrobium sp. Y1847 TaxID=3405419 RepID=UPI003B67F3CF
MYNPAYYAHTFLARQSPQTGILREAPETLWAFWLGGELSAARRASLSALEAQPGLEVRLVRSPDEVLVEGHPFHPSFEHLHAVHRSDYLRAYVMHHHGGVYADVKPFTQALAPVLGRLNADATIWVVGYREITSNYVPDLLHVLGDHIRRHYRAVMGPSGFACRPETAFTAEWMRELHARLDYFVGAFEEAGARDCVPYSAPAAYPIRWSEILGDIIQPLSMKHQAHMLLTNGIRPQLKLYR